MSLKRDKYDKIFSDYIRARAHWKCERCGKQYEPFRAQGLDCSHFHGRRKKSVRYDENNAAALCRGCHQYMGENPLAHVEFFRKRLGGKRFGLLSRRAETMKKWTKSEKEELYSSYKKRISLI